MRQELKQEIRDHRKETNNRFQWTIGVILTTWLTLFLTLWVKQ